MSFKAHLVQRGPVVSLLFGFVVSMLVGFLSVTVYRRGSEATLAAQIVQVESALTEISRLSESLGKLKSDLESTAKEKERIESEYKNATELKTLTESQLAAVRTALAHRSIFEIIRDNLISFFLGVVSSLVATVLWFLAIERRKRRAESGSVYM
jgi:hypothetical protein